MTDTELIAEQQAVIEKLRAQIKKLRRRLKEKKIYEQALLLNTGATPGFIATVDAKDRAALSG